MALDQPHPPRGGSRSIRVIKIRTLPNILELGDQGLGLGDRNEGARS
jgi:hypothetical protein